MVRHYDFFLGGIGRPRDGVVVDGVRGANFCVHDGLVGGSIDTRVRV